MAPETLQKQSLKKAMEINTIFLEKVRNLQKMTSKWCPNG